MNNTKLFTVSAFGIFSLALDIGLILLIKSFMDYNNKNVPDNLYIATLIFLIVPLLMFNILLVSLPVVKKYFTTPVALGGVTVSSFYLIVQLAMTLLFYGKFSIMVFSGISIIFLGVALVSILLIYSIFGKAASWGKTDHERLFKKLPDDLRHINNNYFKD